MAGERVAAAPWIRPAPWGTLGFVVPAAALPAAVSAALPAALALWTRPAELAGTRE